jgi:rubrerythrin
MKPLQHQSKKSQKHTAASIATKRSHEKASFQLLDNRPETVVQQKLQDEIAQKTTPVQLQSKTSSSVIQLGKKKDKKDKKNKNPIRTARKKRKSKKAIADEEEWVPKSQQKNHRYAFSKDLRRQVIMNGALRNKNRMYVCPTCGRPLADPKGNEIKTYYISKSNKRHNIVSAQLDHFPPWAGRRKKLLAQGKSDAEIRKDHDDPSRLRPLCRQCNLSHKYEKRKVLPKSGYSDDEFHSEDEDRDNEVYDKLRKHNDDDDPSTGAAGIVT